MKVINNVYVVAFCYILLNFSKISQCAPPIFNYINQFRSGLITTTSLAANSSHTYNITFGIPIPIPTNTTMRAAVGFIGFQSIATDYFQNAVILQTITPTQIFIQTTAYRVNITNILHVSYIAMNSGAVFVQLLSQCNDWYILGFVPSNLSVGTGLRVDKRSGITTFTYGRTFIMPFLSQFKVQNLYGQTFILKLESSRNEGSQQIQSLVGTDDSNIVTKVCYTILIFNYDVMFAYRQKFHGFVGSKIFTNQSYGSFLNTTSLLKYQDENKNFYAINSFRFNRFFSPSFFLNFSSYTDLSANYTTNPGTQQVIVGFFLFTSRSSCLPEVFDIITQQCITNATCASPKVINVEVPSLPWCGTCHYTCLTCNQSLPHNCLSCDSNSFRIPITNSSNSTCPCMSGFVDQGVTRCVSCKSIIPGCNTCSIVNYTVNCDNCGTLIKLNASNGITVGCKCQSSYFLIQSSFCINTTGCSNYTTNISTGISTCTSCISSNRYKLVPNTTTKQCECLTGYLLNISTEICTSVCGDSILVADQQCDDGNTISNDGCSNVCKVQSGWSCTNTPMPSICTQIVAKYFELKVVYVERITSSNKMRVAIEVRPNNIPYSLSTIKSLISHNVPSSNLDVAYQNGNLMLEFYYSESIQGNIYNLNFTNNPLFPNQTSTLIIPASGINAMLTYDIYYSHNLYLQILIILLDSLALFTLILSMFSQKMIAIEMIQTLQTVFYLMLFMKSCPSQLSPLTYLRYSNGYNYQYPNHSQRTYNLPFNRSFTGIEKQFLLSLNIMLILILVCSVLLVIIRIAIVVYNFKIQQIAKTKQFIKKQRKTQEKYKKLMNKSLTIQRIFNFVFEQIWFILAYSVYFSIIMAIAYQMNDISGFENFLLNSSFNNIASVLCTFILIIVPFTIILNYIVPQKQFLKFMLIKQVYPFYYIIYQTIFIVLLSLGQYSILGAILVGSLIVANIVILICLRPYPEKKHNGAIIFHQIVILLSLIFYFYSENNRINKKQSQKIELIGCYFITFMLYAVVIISIIRLWLWRTTTIVKQSQKNEEKDYIQLAFETIRKNNEIKAIDLKEQKVVKNQLYKTKDFQWIYNDEEIEQKKMTKEKFDPVKKENNNEELEALVELQEYQAKILQQIKEKLKKQLKRDKRREENLD